MANCNKLKIIFLFLLLLLSRLIFLDGSADFFDSSEYIIRTQAFSLLSAMSSGHPPFHPLYLFFNNLFYKTLVLFNFSHPGFAASLPSAVFGSLAVLFFYLLIKNIFGRKTAFLAAFLIAILPFFWISNITVLVDATGCCFLFLAFYLYWLGLNHPLYFWRFFLILLGGISFGFALLAHTSFGLWILVLGGLFVLKECKKQNFFKDFLISLFFLVGPGLAIILYVFLLRYSGLYSSNTDALKFLLFGNIGDRMPFGLARLGWYFWALSTTPIIVLAFLGFLKMFWQRKKELILFIFWLGSSIFASCYIYENLHGRALIPVIFALTALAAYFICTTKPSKIRLPIAVLTILWILNVSLPAVLAYGTQIAPNETLASFEKKLPQNALLIGTNTMRTWDGWGDRYLRFGDVDVGVGEVIKNIEKFLANHQPVYLTSDAIFFPYWRYDGHFYDLRSFTIRRDLSGVPLGSGFFDNNFDFKMFDPRFRKYILELTQEKQVTERIKTDLANLPPEQSLIAGRLVDLGGGTEVSRAMVYLYPENFYIMKENILARDWGYWFYRWLTKVKDPLVWTVTDGQGMFILPYNYPLGKEQLIIFTDSYTTRMQQDPFCFIAHERANLEDLDAKTENNLSEEQLLKKIADLPSNQSFYFKKETGRTQFDLTIFNYRASTTNLIEAENLTNDIGEDAFDPKASSQRARKAVKNSKSGYLTTGPYISLTPGHYRLKISYKIENPNPEAKFLGRFEVSAQEGQVKLINKALSQKNVHPGGYQEISLDFILDKKMSGIEFRTIFNGESDLYLDFFELMKAS